MFAGAPQRSHPQQRATVCSRRSRARPSPATRAPSASAAAASCDPGAASREPDTPLQSCPDESRCVPLAGRTPPAIRPSRADTPRAKQAAFEEFQEDLRKRRGEPSPPPSVTQHDAAVAKVGEVAAAVAVAEATGEANLDGQRRLEMLEIRMKRELAEQRWHADEQPTHQSNVQVRTGLGTEYASRGGKADRQDAHRTCNPQRLVSQALERSAPGADACVLCAAGAAATSPMARYDRFSAALAPLTYKPTFRPLAASLLVLQISSSSKSCRECLLHQAATPALRRSCAHHHFAACPRTWPLPAGSAPAPARQTSPYPVDAPTSALALRTAAGSLVLSAHRQSTASTAPATPSTPSRPGVAQHINQHYGYSTVS
ncbi:hypothetical protein ON010_g16566 [Phytophthora cinnamomi]|nr:hypothetical protein ON010_g16566 [Phytophthora cinnamomi]